MASKKAIADAAAELAARDRVLKRMLRDHGVPELHRPRPRRSHFAQLARMICYQQLAGRAAAAIHGRFEALFDGEPTPEAVLALPFEKLRGAGLSNAKATSIRDLAEKVHSGLVELDRVARLPDEKVVSELVLVRGIGVWTAHMFLIFSLRRPNVLPTGDYGVQMAIRKHYKKRKLPKPKEMEKIARAWEPYRSIACWYMWRSLDIKTV